MMSELCSNVHDREIAVDNAIAASIHEKSHPDKLPRNIYGTDGEWEEYSSPSRDARLKVGFSALALTAGDSAERVPGSEISTSTEAGIPVSNFQPAPAT